MPMHDWTKVEAGIYHDFHLEWIMKIKAAINQRLPKGYYALAEQRTGIFGPDVLTLQMGIPGSENHPWKSSDNGNTTTLQATKPTARGTGSAAKYYFNKQRSITLRHVSHDRLVAVIEIVSPGNISSLTVAEEFVHKVLSFLKHDIHVSFVNPFAASNHAAHGLHSKIWENLTGDDETFLTQDEPFEVVAYEAGEATEFYVRPFAVGMKVPTMPVFLIPGGHIEVPLEETYNAAFEAVPARWRDVVAAGK